MGKDRREERLEVAERPWMRLAGSGIELAAAVGGFAIIGHLIDRSRGSHPKGLLIGAVLGLVGGMYNLVKASLAASRKAREDDQNRQAAAREKQDGSGR